jgi:subtilisin family serine protease
MFFIFLCLVVFTVNAELLVPYLVITRTRGDTNIPGRRLSAATSNVQEALIEETNKFAQLNSRRLQTGELESFTPFASDISPSFTVVPGFSALLSRNAILFLNTLGDVNTSVVLYFDSLVYSGPAEQEPRVQSAQEGADVNEMTWGLDRIDQESLPLDLKYMRAGNGAGVDIYIADSGLRLTHSEFATQGDLRARSANFVNNDAMPRAMGIGEDVNDCAGHGTHLSSTIAGRTMGVAPGSRIIPVRIYGCTASGPVSAVLRGFDFILSSMKSRPNVPAVINLSFAAKRLDVLDEAVRSLANAGGVVVAAAGNSFKNACTTSPAAERSCIAVGATTKIDEWSSFSDYGECIFLSAPGSEILGASNDGDNDSLYMSGTSMAAPHVSGVIAIILQTQLDAGRRLSVSQTRQILHCISSDITWTNPTVVAGNTATTFLFMPPSGIPTHCLPENLPLWSTPPSTSPSPSNTLPSKSSTSSVTFKDGFFSVSSGAKRSSPSSYVGLAVAVGLTLLLLRRI